MGFFDFLRSSPTKTETTPMSPPVSPATPTMGPTVSDATPAEESAIGSLLGEGGAKLSGLLDKLGAGGLDDAVKSWIGKGENKAVSVDQIKAALSSDEVAAVAAKLGVSSDEAAGKIAKVLPTVIDKLTPDGLVPDPEALASKVTGLFR